MLEEVGLSSLILSPQTVLVKNGVKLTLRLGGNVEVQVLVPVGDVFPEVDLTRMDLPGEDLSPLSTSTRPLSSVSRMGKRNMSSMLVAVTTRPHWLIGPVGRIRIFSPTSELMMASAWWGIVEAVGVGHVRTQSMAKELLDNGDWAVVRLRDVPKVGVATGVAVSRIPWARKGPLLILIDDLIIFDDQVDRLKVQFIVEGDHVIEGLV